MEAVAVIGWRWVHGEWIHLLWLALGVTVAIAVLERRSRELLRRFVSTAMQERLAVTVGVERRWARWVAIFAVFAFGVLALLRPQTRGDIETERGHKVSADIVVVLDVSKSMLAEDAAPNRLSRAKAEISALLDELAGHRVGLVAFAGKAAVLSPLTPDYGFFRMMLRGADPTSVSRGGTAIGEAIRAGVDAFDDDSSASRLMLLITDGEDHDSYPKEAAKEAEEAGVRIVAIAFGSEDGSQITITDPQTGAREVMTHEGQPVISRVDGPLLREIALMTDGAFIPAGVAALDLKSIVDEHIEPMVEETRVSSVRVVPGERYPWLIIAALASLLMALWLSVAPAARRFS